MEQTTVLGIPATICYQEQDQTAMDAGEKHCAGVFQGQDQVTGVFQGQDQVTAELEDKMFLTVAFEAALKAPDLKRSARQRSHPNEPWYAGKAHRRWKS